MFDDLKSAWRRLRHAPGFAAAAILTLAIAVGANTAILSIADAVLFRPLPYADADRVFVIQMFSRQTMRQYTRVDVADLRTIDERHTGLGRTEMLGPGPTVRLSTPDGPTAIRTMAATPNYFGVLGVRAAHGRLFSEEDAREPGRAAVLSYSAWRQRFAGDESIVGRTITLGTSTFDVIGVLPVDFLFPAGSFFVGKPELVTVQPKPAAGAAGGTFHPIARLEPGVTRDQAQAELDTLAADLGRSDPKRAQSMPYLNDVRSMLYPTGRPVMQFMVAAAGLVFLLGCANLANMLMVRGRSRERETAVRSALGASRIRVVRPVVIEALMIGTAGAGLAVALTWGMFDALLSYVPPIAYGNAHIGVDARVIAIGLALGILGALLFAAVPAWRTLRLDVQAIIQGRHRRGASRASRAGRPMVALQVAVAVVLVFGAVLAARAFVAVLRVPLGFETHNIVTVLTMPPQKTADPQGFYLEAMTRIGQLPGVESVGAAGSLPFDGSAYDEGVMPAGSTVGVAGIVHVLPGFIEAVGIPVRRGRALTGDDLRSNPAAAMLSESAARVLFPNDEALGQIFDNGRGRTLHVVGIVADVKKSLEREDQPAVYAIPGTAARRLSIVVKTRARQESIVVDIRRAVAALGPSTGVSTAWWSDTISNVTAIRNPRFQTMVLSSFAAVALSLTAVGTFTVVAFLVAARSREMGLRLAIGASPTSLVRLMVRQAVAPVMLGLLLGLAATRWLSRFAESQLYQVNTNDPATLAGAAVTVLAAATIAAYIPARRVTRVDPAMVLRTE